MARRRILVSTGLLLVLVLLASSMSPREESTEPRPPVAAAGASDVRTISGRLPDDETVRARVGDLVELRVDAPSPDTVRIVDLGLDVPAEPDLPGELRFLATREGRFPVVLRDADRRVGVLRILPAR